MKATDNAVPEADIDCVAALAVEAGEATLRWYRSADAGVRFKADESPLTNADLASHAMICERLARWFPAIPVLSEEAADVPYAQRSAWQRFWLIDPLDGTREFIHHRDEFTVNIALIDNGAPILGVVRSPVLGVTYGGMAGAGAWKQVGDEPRRPIAAAPWSAASTLRLVASRSHAGQQLQAYVAALPRHTCISMGSSLKLCLVAEGAADLYPRLGPTMEWDTAAADCVVRAAGGRVTDLAGHDMVYNKEDLHNPYFVVAGTPPFPWQGYLAAADATQ